MRKSDTLEVGDLKRLSPQSRSISPAVQDPGSQAATGALPLGPLPEDGISLVEMEKEIIRRALVICGGNRSKTALFLSIPRHVLIYRLEKYDLG